MKIITWIICLLLDRDLWPFEKHNFDCVQNIFFGGIQPNRSSLRVFFPYELCVYWFQISHCQRPRCWTVGSCEESSPRQGSPKFLGADHTDKLLKVGLVGLCYQIQAQQKSILPCCDSTYNTIVLSPISIYFITFVVRFFHQNLILDIKMNCCIGILRGGKDLHDLKLASASTLESSSFVGAKSVPSDMERLTIFGRLYISNECGFKLVGTSNPLK